MACPNSPRPKKARQVKSKVKYIIFFDIKGIVHKESVLAGQMVNSAYCCDILQQLRENV
jgi:trehalose-6-phosphatase